MYNMSRSIVAWVRSLNDVTQLCLALTLGCFVVGAILLVANTFVPLGARGGALLAVGCFYLCHGIVEGLKKRQRKNEDVLGDSGIWPWGQRPLDDTAGANGEASGSLAA